MVTAGPPTEVTPQRAAEILGITEAELAQMLSDLVGQRLAKIARRIDHFSLETLDQFDEAVAEARTIFESLVAVWAAIDATPDQTEED